MKIDDLPTIAPETPKPAAKPAPVYNPTPLIEPVEVPPKPPNRRPVWLIVLLVIIAICLCIGCLAAAGFGAYSTITRQEGEPASVAVLPAEITVQAEPVTPETAAPIPTDAPVPTEQPDFPGREVFAQGIHFNLSEDVAQDVFGETVPAETGSDVPEWEFYPEHIKINFSGYQSTGETFHQPQLFVYPTKQFAEINPSAAEIIEDLKLALATKSASSADDHLPFLPLWNAAQMFQSNIAYIDFQNGSGIRYLTQFGQDVYPINNYSLFYTFQGLTSDERFYIAAIFPVSNPALPDPDTIEMDQAFYDTFEQYINGIEFLLDAQTPESFSPSLIVLDQLIESMRIDR